MAEADRINEIRERAERATPGPWRAGLGELRPHLDYATTDIVTGWTRESQHGMGTLAGACIVTGGEWDNEADVEFIAHAREDIACLLALLETTGRSLEEWKRTAVLAANDAARLRGRPPTDEEVWELPGPGESQERDAAAYASDRGTFSNHRGTLDSFPPYVGGDDDTIDEWQAECMCGWRGVKTDSVTRAHMDLIAHLNGALRGTPQTAEPSPSDVAPDVVPGVLCVAPEANEPPPNHSAVVPHGQRDGDGEVDARGGSLASEAQRDADIERVRRELEMWRDAARVEGWQDDEEKATEALAALARLVDAPPPGQSLGGHRSAVPSEGSGEGAC